MRGAMPEANVLYSVTAVVVAGLIVWVAAVLKTAKEPWNRAVPSSSGALASASTVDADSTARATSVALANEAKTKSADDADA
ncbi:MAG: hypothetical protein BGO98_49915 [Myxococcales bacterium 68-20]|nr:MAG: hypothetical protein BGO98_49915 [Myxococcales bacterium 68-20]